MPDVPTISPTDSVSPLPRDFAASDAEPSNANPLVVSRQSETNAPTATPLFAPPPKRELPRAKPARKAIAIIPADTKGFTFDRAYRQAFESYEAVKKLEAEAKASGESDKYHQKLGESIGLLRAALRVGSVQVDNQYLDELRYLLAHSYLRAGRLAEASVMAQAVARWGDKAKPATKEAVMIGLAATQEASLTHWGDPEQVGELDQMHAITNLLAERWPEDAQLDLIRLNLAQSYERFNHPLKAASVYRLIGKDSQHYATAQLAAGGALWTEYRNLAAATATDANRNVERVNKVRDQARKFLANAVEVLTGDSEKPNKKVLTAKLSLARIEMSAGRLAEAEKWLVAPPMSLIDSIVTEPSNENDDKTVAYSLCVCSIGLRNTLLGAHAIEKPDRRQRSTGRVVKKTGRRRRGARQTLFECCH